MAWINSTATDYRDMLDQLIEIATSDHVATVALVAGGTGYSVDDIITLTDGTFTHAASFRVLTLSGSAIATLQMEEHGAYTVDPDLTATTAHGVVPSGGTGATFNLTMESEPWTVERRAQQAVSATIDDGGTGYTVGDDITLTLDGGGVLGDADNGVLPVFNVDSVSGGIVTAVSLVTAGHLEETPDVNGNAGLQANTTGGTGANDCILTVTYANKQSSTEDVVILSGPGEGGTDQILCGFRTFQESDVSTFNTVFNWGLYGMTDFTAGLPMHDQNNISPGLVSSTGALEAVTGAFMVLKDSDAFNITFWASVTNRRIILVCKIETATTAHYASMYVGFLNQFGTATEVPYPLWIQGCTSRRNSWWGDTVIGRISGLSDAFAVASSLEGPAFFRDSDGTWRAYKNSSANDGGSPSRTGFTDYTVFPAHLSALDADSDDILTALPAGISMATFAPTAGVPGTADMKLRPTPNSGDDARLMIPLSPMATNRVNSPLTLIFEPRGELDNCFWIPASDATTPLTSEDVQKVGDDRYIVFQNGTQTEDFSYFCIKAE